MKQKLAPTNMTSLLDCIRLAQQDGFRLQFQITEQGLHDVANDKRFYQPEQITVINFYRFEGASDPSEIAILYLLQTSDGEKGVLTDAYGAYADPLVGAFMEKVESIGKQQKH
jgi:hypothetical protein